MTHGRRAAVTALLAMTLAGPAGAAGVSGAWGGDRLQLTADAQGVRVEMDCASGSIPTRIAPDAAGHFDVRGSFQRHRAGPQPGDAPAAAAGARFSGEVHGATMTLSILPDGEREPLAFTLREGVRVKLVRCL